MQAIPAVRFVKQTAEKSAASLRRRRAAVRRRSARRRFFGDHGRSAVRQPLRVTVSGGGPVGLVFALMLDDLMGDRAAIAVFDHRWTRTDSHDEAGQVTWKDRDRGIARRQQVVTVQSRQWSKLSPELRRRLFQPGCYTEMWPRSSDSVDDLPPRNLRIAHIEDQLLAAVNDRSDHIMLMPEAFHPEESERFDGQHVLAVCDGARSRTREHFIDRFGVADTSMYALAGQHVHDVVLGLRVKSDLSDPMAVLFTVAQNRFLLNSLNGEGFLNMRLTDAEAAEAVGIDPIRQVFARCVQTQPCLMTRDAEELFRCSTHGAYFLPALLKKSPLWARVQEGLQLFGVEERNLSAVTCYRFEMVHRPRFSAQLFPRTNSTPGTFGFLLGDAANAIHIWPGRGVNSGLASAISLARDLADRSGEPLRDADFVRHEAIMAMLQYRHKSRAWRQMVSADDLGVQLAIKDRIAGAIEEAETGQPPSRDELVDVMLDRMMVIRDRLKTRLPGLPTAAAIRERLVQLTSTMLHTLLVSDAWDFADVGGEEVDVDWLLAPT